MEIIIVVFLISLSLAVFLGINFRQKESLQLKSDGRQVFSLLQAAKSYALLYGTSNDCLYDPGRNVVFESLRNKTVGLHDEVIIPRPGEDSTDNEKPFVVMSFFADGSAGGGEVELRSGKRRLYLQVDPILGEVKISDTSSSAAQ